MKNQDLVLFCNGSLMLESSFYRFSSLSLSIFSSFPNFSSYNLPKKWYYCSETNLKEE